MLLIIATHRMPGSGGGHGGCVNSGAGIHPSCVDFPLGAASTKVHAVHLYYDVSRWLLAGDANPETLFSGDASCHTRHTYSDERVPPGGNNNNNNKRHNRQQPITEVNDVLGDERWGREREKGHSGGS